MDRGKKFDLRVEMGQEELCLQINGMAICVSLQNAGGAMPTITLKTTGARPQPAAASVKESTAPESADLVEELDYYRQICQEIYEGIGKLAKEINISIQDISLAEIVQTGMSSPGEQLDQMRDQVADVLHMTEEATLNILDRVEQIREDCLTVQKQLLNLAQSEGEPGEEISAESLLAPGWEEVKAQWDQLLVQGEELGQHLQTLAPGGAAPAAGPAAGPHFPFPEILQIVLEFCGNEKVKQHLKAVQSQKDTPFQVAEIETAISRLAETVTFEDGFYQFPVEHVLIILKDNCTEDRVKELFAKVLESADKLFPMPTFPLESHDAAEGSQPVVEPEVLPDNEIIPLWEGFFQNLRHLVEQLATPAAPAGSATGGNAAAVAVAQEALPLVDRITKSLSRIMEALSFQDLSGQRLLKILKLLRQVQVQVLTLLVAAGNKLRLKEEDKALFSGEGEVLTQEDLDRRLHSIISALPNGSVPDHPPEGQVLNQDSINELLTNMGF